MTNIIKNIKENWKNIILNAIVTFAQAYIPIWALYDFKIEQLALTAGISAGLSAVYNVVIKPIFDLK